MNELVESLRVVALAGLLGACIGLERELARRPAGLRTHILVAVAAAALMMIGDGVAERFAREQQAVRVASDPLRVIEAIVVGISFLGAGTIIQGRGRVEGLTTAASILITAAIGLAVATGESLFAAALTGAVVVTLLALGRLEQWLGTAQAPLSTSGRGAGAEPPG
jgi:putative Mg2+ transporter-C (MgtC) family protein